MASLPDYVKPATTADNHRVKTQALRYRILNDEHRKDVENDIERTMSPEVAAELSWNVDLSANPLRDIYNQLNTAYMNAPAVHIRDGAELQALTPEQAEAIITPTFWPLMKQRALQQMAIRESVVRLDWPTAAALEDGDPAEVRYRVVPPHCIHKAIAHRRHPDRLAYVEELRERHRMVTDKETGESVPVMVWTYDVWDVRDPDNPVFRIDEIVNNIGSVTRRDATREFLGIADEVEAGLDYPYRDTSGAPILPYVLAHAQVQSRLWDYMSGDGLVDGTLKLAAGWTKWWDGFDNSSNPQRLIVDGKIGGARVTDGREGDNVKTVPVTPKTILMVTSNGQPGTAKTDSFPPGMDPKAGTESLEVYERRLAVSAGLSPADLQMTGSAQSGIAIEVSREGKRRAQQSYEPGFRLADQQILSTAARMANAGIPGLDLPENPRAWSVAYAVLGESPQERKVKVETITLEQNAGTLGRVAAVRRLNPNLETDEEAIAYIAEQARTDALAKQAEAQARGEVGPDLDSMGAEAATIYAIIEEALSQGRALTPDEVNDILESAAEVVGLSTPQQDDEAGADG